MAASRSFLPFSFAFRSVAVMWLDVLQVILLAIRLLRGLIRKNRKNLGEFQYKRLCIIVEGTFLEFSLCGYCKKLHK